MMESGIVVWEQLARSGLARNGVTRTGKEECGRGRGTWDAWQGEEGRRRWMGSGDGRGGGGGRLGLGATGGGGVMVLWYSRGIRVPGGGGEVRW